MQAEDENRNTGGGMMMPPQGFAFNPLFAGQMNFPVQPSFAPYAQYKPAHGRNAMDDLTNAFGGVKPFMSAPNGGYPQTNTQVPAPIYYRLQDGTLLSRTIPPQQYPGASYLFPQGAQYQALPGTPGHFSWNYGSQDPGEAAPGLGRRNSVSSNEEVGPKTPFFAGKLAVDQYKKSMMFNGDSPPTWSTPSPYSLAYGSTPNPQQLMKIDGEYKGVNFDEICSQDPKIPKPVPAIFSSEKARGTLDKCLKNETNTTNVYIRGLHPDTSDDMLTAYGARFGSIMSAKSMLDQGTGMCKGFGFIKYHNFDDGENCIRGFFHLGYEAKWARVSHNERLKTLGDENNTNLYISNLPMTYNEQMLMSIFDGYEVMSSKILRDENGISRGVGFARFSTPEVCSEVISKFTGTTLAEGYQLSIRFADTPDQKKLKSLTAERRQFKTHEYNTAAYGPGSPYAQTASPGMANFPSPVTSKYVPSATYSGQTPMVATYGGQVVVPAAPATVPHMSHVAVTNENATRGGSVPDRAVKIESPSVVAHAKRTSMVNSKEPMKLHVKEGSADEDVLKPITNAGTRCDVKDVSTASATKTGSPVKVSPVKGGPRVTPSKTPRNKRY